MDKSAKLLDSIINDFPIGTFVIWKTREILANERNIYGINVPDTPEGDPVKYVLDGQQRITTLLAAIKGLNINGVDYKQIFLNLDCPEDDTITINKFENSISVHELLYDESILLESDWPIETRKKFLQYRDKFATYVFPALELDGDPIEKAVDVFTRINTTGQPLTLFEIMAAKTYDEKKKFDLVDKHEHLNTELEGSKYRINGSTLLQSLSININQKCTRGDILRLDKSRIIAVYDQTVKSIKNAIDYFRDTYSVQVSRMLPYESLLVPFQYFFFNNKNRRPDSDQSKILQAYFWRSSLTSRFSKAVESTLEHDCRLIDEIRTKSTTTSSLDGIRVTLTAEDIKYYKFRTGESVCKSILCLLASFGPKSFRDNSNIVLNSSNLSRSNSRNYHHIFPKAYLKKRGITDSNVIANVSLIGAHENLEIKTKAPSEYMKIFSQQNVDLENTLVTHLIDDLSNYGLLNDDYDLFLTKRSSRIFEELNKKCSL